MEKIRNVLKTRNNLKYIIAAVLVMGLVGIVGVNVFAVASPLQFKVAGSVKTSMTLATPVTMGSTIPQEDLFTYGLTDATLAKKDIVWKLTSSSDIAIFSNNIDTVYGNDVINNNDKLGINIKSAGVAIVNGQPRKADADGNLVSDNIESANFKIISPLDITVSSSATSGSAPTITSTPQDGVNVISAGSEDQIDPDTITWLNFRTNAAYSNLTVLIQNTSYTVKNTATPSTNEITYNNGTVSIPTAILKAGISTISIQTSDIASADSSTEQASLKKDYRINVKPVFLKSAISNAQTVAENDPNKLMKRSDGYYYYVFSEGVIKGGNRIVDLSTISNIASDPSKYSVTIQSSTPVEDGLCYISGSKITANEVGITTVNVKVSDDIKLSFKVVIPYVQYKGYKKVMSIGDTVTLNTTGGTKDLSNSSNTFVTIKWPTVTAIKAGTTTVRSGLNLSTYKKNDSDSSAVYNLSEIELLSDIYSYQDYKKSIDSDFTFEIIDSLTLSDDTAKVNIGDTIELTVKTTNSSDINVTTSKVEHVTANGDITHTKELVSNENNVYVYKITVTGVKEGFINLVVSQTINGAPSTKPCEIEVVQPIDDISFSQLPDIYVEDEATEIIAYFSPASDKIKKVEWYSDDRTIATVASTETINPGSKISQVKALIKGVSRGSTDIHLKVYYTDNAATEDAHLSVNVKSHIDSITLNEKQVDGKADGSFQLLATVKYKDGTTTINDGVTYTQTSFGDEPVVSVDPVTGLVKFLKPGKATVTATVSDSVDKKEAECFFNIEVPIKDIELDHKDVQITIGETISIKAIITPFDATNQTVTWETSDKSVATVEFADNDSINVKVTGVAHGTATIICKAADGQIRMCTVYVKQPVTGITLDSQETITIRKGQSIYLNATILPYNADDKTVVWSSSRPEYCTVDQYGMITGIEPTGENYEAVITVTSNDNPEIFATCRVKVIQPITGITLNSTYQEMWVGSKYAIIPDIQPADADNKKVTYISSDPEVASVDENGIVTALKGGTTVIEITTEQYGLKATCTILVKEYVTSITLDASEKYLGLGKTDKLTATVEAATATNRNVVWSSSDPDICSVDQQGNITGNNLGNAVITATAADGSGVVATCIVHVTESINGLRVEPDTVRIAIGSSYIVSAITDDGNVTNDVVWTSSNESIATVDEMGEIFGLSTGKCKVTATAKTDSMVSASCWVYVTPVVNISSLKINSSEIYMLTGKQRQLAVRVRPAVNTDSYDWYSTDTGIVTVNGSGLITTVGPGIADVVVESTNNGVSSACTVHSLAISRSNMRLEQYDSNVLDVIGIESGDKVTWRSSNPRIATVDASGNVIGRMRGTCNITAVTHDKTLYCTVTVFTAKKYN